jgi:hypothetical protein
MLINKIFKENDELTLRIDIDKDFEELITKVKYGEI